MIQPNIPDIYSYKFDKLLNRIVEDIGSNPLVYDIINGRISPVAIGSGGLAFSPGGKIVLGSIGSIIVLDPERGLHIGALLFADAPYRVNLEGEVVGDTATFSQYFLKDIDTVDSVIAGRTYEAVVDSGGDGDYATIGAAITAGATRIFVRNGEYNENEASIPNGCHIVGEDKKSTIINFGTNSTKEWNVGGVEEYTLGTITLTNNDATVVGDGTSWDGNVTVGNFIYDSVAHKWYEIASVTDDTHLEMTEVYRGDTNAGQAYLIGSLVRDVVVKGLAFTRNGSGVDTYYIMNLENYSDNCDVTDCKFTDTAASSGIQAVRTGIYSTNHTIKNNFATNCKTGIALQGHNATVQNNHSENNVEYGLQIAAGTHNQVSNNTCNNNTIDGIYVHSNSNNNHVLNNRCTKNGQDGIKLTGAEENVIIGNQCTRNTDDGIDLTSGAAKNNIILGNNCSDNGNDGIDSASNSSNIVVGNVCVDNGAFGVDPYIKTIMLGNILEGNASGAIGTEFQNIIQANRGTSALEKTEVVRMKNTSGGELVSGDMVILKAVAAGDEVTTTTAQGNDLVFGMVIETIANDAYGDIQTLGKATSLKVDGTTDIAIGDFIGCFTTAKIGMKASAGDMAIAIALEAYTTDDSSGVIDALLITPRKI